MPPIRPALLALLLAAGCGPGGEAAAAPARARAVVLVELFTSQGCSSCPPADRLLGQLPDAADGIEVLPLAFHVDYWDDLGWHDPFSRAEWTARQREYAGALARGRIYTPQLVVQGSAEMVGSDRGAALDAIRRAARRPANGARIQAITSGRDRMTVAVDAALPSGAGRADAWVALVESGLATDVARGENQGRALVDDFVVRQLVRAFQIEAGGSRRGQVELAVDRTWRRDRLAVTVFLQDPGNRAVLAAARSR